MKAEFGSRSSFRRFSLSGTDFLQSRTKHGQTQRELLFAAREQPRGSRPVLLQERRGFSTAPSRSRAGVPCAWWLLVTSAGNRRGAALAPHVAQHPEHPARRVGSLESFPVSEEE